MDNQTTTQQQTRTLSATDARIAAQAASWAQTADALRHLEQFDLNDLEAHALLGWLCAEAPRAVIEGIHRIITARDQVRS